LSISKKMCLVKKKEFISNNLAIHLPKPLTYIRNPEGNKIMFILFHLLKIYIRNHFLFFIFFTVPPTGKRP
jgi:hypothetical protein